MYNNSISTIVKFKLELVGSKCNEYPQLTILHNQQIIYSGLITECVTLEFDLDMKEHNVITLSGIDKSSGENGKWDTQLNNSGQIIADKSLAINNIWFNNISMGHEWIRSLTLVNNNHEKFLTRTWWNNGSISFSIQEPLLDWIIQEKFINSEENTIVPHHAKGGERRFNYMYIQEKIKAIRKIIND